MKYWKPDVKRLEEKRKAINLKYQKDKKTLLDKIISSVAAELLIIYEEIIRDYGFKRYDPPVSGAKLIDIGRGKKYVFYLWQIYLNVGCFKDDNYIRLILCGDRVYELPDSFELESSDNYNPNFRETYHKGISPKGLRLLFKRQLKKMGYQKKESLKTAKN